MSYRTNEGVRALARNTPGPLDRGLSIFLQRNDPGDREKAMSLLDESLSISNELGMRPLMERVLSRREILRA